MAVELYDDIEQGERVKQWIKENGGGILLGIALAVAGIFGFRYWQDQQVQQNYAAAEYYRIVNDELVELNAAQPAGAAESSDETASETAGEDDSVALNQALSTLQNDYTDNLYAALATLQLADHKIRTDDLEAASQQYRFIIDNTDNQQMRALARLRLARTQLAMGQSDAVLQTLNGLSVQDAYAGLSARIRGEAYLAMNDREQALAAFEQAEEELGGNPDRMLELRLADLREVDVQALQEDAEQNLPPVFPGAGGAPLLPVPSAEQATRQPQIIINRPDDAGENTDAQTAAGDQTSGEGDQE